MATSTIKKAQPKIKITNGVQARQNGQTQAVKPTADDRLKVLKTYKIYVGGQFPRTESGRYYAPQNSKGENLTSIRHLALAPSV